MTRTTQNKEAEAPKATADTPRAEENNKEELDSAIKSVRRSKYTKKQQREIVKSLNRALGDNPFE